MQNQLTTNHFVNLTQTSQALIKNILYKIKREEFQILRWPAYRRSLSYNWSSHFYCSIFFFPFFFSPSLSNSQDWEIVRCGWLEMRVCVSFVWESTANILNIQICDPSPSGSSKANCSFKSRASQYCAKIRFWWESIAVFWFCKPWGPWDESNV